MFYTRGAIKAHGSLEQAARRVPMAAAHVLAQRIKKRAIGGDIAGQRFGGYPGRRAIPSEMAHRHMWPKGYRIIPDRYDVPGAAPPIHESGNGYVVFASSDELHRSTRAGSFNVTGGMWSGLTVVGMVREAKVSFRYRSVGQEPFSRKTKRRGRHVKGLKVSNALKAGTVLNKRHVNLLAPKHSELMGLTDGIAWVHAKKQLATVGHFKVNWTSVPSLSPLAQAIAGKI